MTEHEREVRLLVLQNRQLRRDVNLLKAEVKLLSKTLADHLTHAVAAELVELDFILEDFTDHPFTPSIDYGPSNVYFPEPDRLD